MKSILVVALCCLWLTVSHADDERILMEATINGHPVHLAFDTGASDLILLRPTAERLGLRITNASPDFHPGSGRVAFGVTEECSFTMLNQNLRASFYVIDVPAYVAVSSRVLDGAVGWPSISHNIVLIEASTQAVFFLPGVPNDTATWIKFRVATNSDILKLEIPNPAGRKAILTVDSGAYQGVMLNPRRWREWKAAHANQPMTLDAFYTVAAGVTVREQALAGELSLGPLALTNVPVIEADTVDTADSDPSEYEATLGFAALKQLMANKELPTCGPKKHQACITSTTAWARSSCRLTREVMTLSLKW